MQKGNMNYVRNCFRELHRSFFVLSSIFAFFALLYEPLETAESLCPLYESGPQIIKSAVLFAVYTILFYCGITFLYNYLNGLKPSGRVRHLSYSGKAAALALLWLPHIIAAYPANLPPDTENQLEQFMGYAPFTAHHPPAHTWLIGSCVKLGMRLFHSYNIGIFICVILQYIVMVLIFAYTLHFLEERRVSEAVLAILWVIYGLCPLITGFLGVVLKDVMYSAFFVLFVIFCVRFGENPSFRISLRDAAGLGASGICVILMRNNGKYVIYPMCLVLFLVIVIHNRKDRGQWTKALFVLAAPAVVSVLILNSLTSAYRIAPGSIREALSFPFQQTARTVSKHADEIPEEEREVIDKVLEYDKIGRWYDYKICDPVKLTYREEASQEELLNYFKIWGKEFIRYPATYITATLMQNYPLLCLFYDNGYYYNKNDIFYWFYGAVHKIPVAGLIANMSFYCMLLFVLTAYVWRRRRYGLLLALLPLWLSFGICLLAPAIINNARYAFPICYSIPFLVGCYTVYPDRQQRY